MNTQTPDADTGTIVALLERMRTQGLPRALDIKTKVDSGQRLDDFDLAFLDEVLADSEAAKPLWDRHPELNDIAARLIHLYHEISAKALANEQAAQGAG